MRHTNLSLTIILGLFALSAVHTFWGRQLPSFVWIISLGACILNGFYIGFSIASFPMNLVVSIGFSLSFLGITILHRLARKKHDI
jgi:hypothetical protein